MAAEGCDILLVEDNQDDAELALLAFDREGVSWHLKLARDGEEALAYLLPEGTYSEQRKSPSPKVVLLDIKLPGLSGLDVLETLRRDPRTRYLPVVCIGVMRWARTVSFASRWTSASSSRPLPEFSTIGWI